MCKLSPLHPGYVMTVCVETVEKRARSEHRRSIEVREAENMLVLDSDSGRGRSSCGRLRFAGDQTRATDDDDNDGGSE